MQSKKKEGSQGSSDASFHQLLLKSTSSPIQVRCGSLPVIFLSDSYTGTAGKPSLNDHTLLFTFQYEPSVVKYEGLERSIKAGDFDIVFETQETRDAREKEVDARSKLINSRENSPKKAELVAEAQKLNAEAQRLMEKTFAQRVTFATSGFMDPSVPGVNASYTKYIGDIGQSEALYRGQLTALGGALELPKIDWLREVTLAVDRETSQVTLSVRQLRKGK